MTQLMEQQGSCRDRLIDKPYIGQNVHPTIILIFKNSENVLNDTIFEVFFSFSEKQIHQVCKFHDRKHCHYLSTYIFFFLFGVILVGMGIGNK